MGDGVGYCIQYPITKTTASCQEENHVLLYPIQKTDAGDVAHKPLSSSVTKQIRAIAVSAPDSVSGAKSDRALNSSDPVSLFNACRCAARNAQEGIGAWAESTWAQPAEKLRKLFLLMYSLDDMEHLKTLLLSERPNLLLIGAMTLCMPGAIECAKFARELLGNELLIILGGRHINETMYLYDEKTRTASSVRHHKASPGKLIRNKVIPPVFDIIIAGECEEIIPEIGILHSNSPRDTIAYIANNLHTQTKGKWIADFPSLNTTVISDGTPLKHDELPSVVGTFGTSASFSVFGNRMTSHIFSDTGPGCIYDCNFCSERRSVTGSIQENQGAPKRIYNQLKETISMIRKEHTDRKASAFVEDSIFLSSSVSAIDRLCQLLEERPLDIIFGGQFTIDQILRKKESIRRLGTVGLRYVFIGLETIDPLAIGGMSKDINSTKQSWEERFKETLIFLQENRISCGCALLFGLGEPQNSRLELLNNLIKLKKQTGQPAIISANWAVQHPLKDCRESANEDYLRWGTPEGEILECFHAFGEASLEYPLSGVSPPSLREIKIITSLLDEFEAIND